MDDKYCIPEDQPFHQESEAYAKGLENSPDATIIVDNKGQIIIINAQAELMFGYTKTELIGKDISIFIPDDRKKIHESHIEKFYQSPKIREMGVGLILEAINRGGQKFKVQILLSPFVISGYGIHTMAVIRRIKSEVTESIKLLKDDQ